MKIKTNRLFILTLGIVLLMPLKGCDEDKLEISNPNTVSQLDFFRNEADFRVAVNGMIHPITAVFFWGRVVHTGPMLRSDAFNVVPFANNTTMSTLQGVPGVSRWATDMFPQLYQTIFRANTILEEANDENLPTGSVRDEILGQAYFMRAFANWYLAAFWGNAPLVLSTPESDEDFFPNQSTQTEIFNAVISDLEMAATMLPSTWSSSDLGRPTSGAALALRGKTYLYMGNFSAAATDFQAVVNSGVYELLSGAQYEENFTTVSENNVESVFELQFSPQDNFVWGSDAPLTGSQSNFYIDYSPPTVSLDRSHYINPHILQTFEDNGDIVRRNATIAFDYPGATGYGGVPFLEDFAPDIEAAQVAGVDALFTRKYAMLFAGTRQELPGFGQTVGVNWRLIRYSDVLLMLAEAENENGDQAAAIDLINQVRQRAEIADLPAGLSQQEVFDAIVEERIMELTGEGHRFLDLVRWGLADDVMGQGSTIAGGRHPKSLAGESAFFTPGRDELLWIPVPELNANPNLNQNPGY
ncbi:RagB/SusD family nutrient uptake outer membrane protein [Croceitalea rosinachiae]|uniref:RagB/SusD family nutrient uptake outer membrane protein n=1 Tax=Croceitalea rosinachiae TaxID=3075596 RepID=A0ABU3A641_9FLAO|nr:RagB/SusD family nutrient uptake outer membrane protein [Croceitalea sp. F388]MDT0605629.1 RagB/SusD family nutrient uptake outer membrane protein [Croceitalea sp. F388]